MKNIRFLFRLCVSMKNDTDLLTIIKSSEFYWGKKWNPAQYRTTICRFVRNTVVGKKKSSVITQFMTRAVPTFHVFVLWKRLCIPDYFCITCIVNKYTHYCRPCKCVVRVYYFSCVSYFELFLTGVFLSLSWILYTQNPVWIRSLGHSMHYINDTAWRIPLTYTNTYQ